MIALGYLASIFMGITLGMIGGGGSILTVPILVYLFGIDPVTATAYSLFIVGLTALAGGATYLKQGNVDLKTGFIFAIPSFIGVYFTRAYLVPSLPDPVFTVLETAFPKALFIMLIFSALMLAASVSMILPSGKKERKPVSPLLRILIIGLEGLIVGVVTGLVGAGGGFLIIPALVILVGLPMKIAVGTSLFIIAAKSLLGFLGDVQTKVYIDWALLLQVSGIALIGIFLGMAAAKKVDEKILKKGFGYFVLIMGTFILIDQLQKL